MAIRKNFWLKPYNLGYFESGKIVLFLAYSGHFRALNIDYFTFSGFSGIF